MKIKSAVQFYPNDYGKNIEKFLSSLDEDKGNMILEVSIAFKGQNPSSAELDMLYDIQAYYKWVGGQDFRLEFPEVEGFIDGDISHVTPHMTFNKDKILKSSKKVVLDRQKYEPKEFVVDMLENFLHNIR